MATKLQMRDRATGRVIDVDEDEWEEFCRQKKKILRDGQGMRVPMMVADAAGRERPNWMAADGGASLVEDETCYVTDALGRPAGRRPGYMFAATDVAQQRLDDAYAEAERALSSAWRGNPALPRGASANAVEDPDELRRRAFNPEALPRVVAAHVAAPARGNNNNADEDPYEAYKRLLSNAWRTR